MRTLARFPSVRSRWLRKPMNSHAYKKWLLDSGSLTRRLQRASPNFKVIPTRFSIGNAIKDEVDLLALGPKQNALIREVYLQCNGISRVYAHSVLPLGSLRGEWNQLGRLGSRPLGGALFSNPKVRRTPLEFRKLSPNHLHPLYYLAIRGLEDKPRAIWARRSVFFLGSASLLVTEVFLPQILFL